LALFDGADPNAGTARRSPTVVPTQALFFLNDPFVHAQADLMSERVLAATEEPTCRISLAHEMALGRGADAIETAAALDFLEAYSKGLAEAAVAAPERRRAVWAAYCRTLFARNEFVYID
jgi:hypothetical protein